MTLSSNSLIATAVEPDENDVVIAGRYPDSCDHVTDCAGRLPLPRMSQGGFLGMDLVGPAIDFVKLAESLGVEAARLTEPDAVAGEDGASRRADDRPRLFKVPIGR